MANLTVSLTAAQVNYLQTLLAPQLAELAGSPSAPNTNAEEGKSGNAFTSGELATVQAVKAALAAAR